MHEWSTIFQYFSRILSQGRTCTFLISSFLTLQVKHWEISKPDLGFPHENTYCVYFSELFLFCSTLFKKIWGKRMERKTCITGILTGRGVHKLSTIFQCLSHLLLTHSTRELNGKLVLPIFRQEEMHKFGECENKHRMGATNWHHLPNEFHTRMCM